MMLDFGEAVRRFYGHYTNANGRSQRSAFWWVALYEVIIYSVLIIVMLMSDGGMELARQLGDMIGGGTELNAEFDFDLGPSGVFAIFAILLFALVNFLPGIMLRIRRFHDLGQTGWLVLVFLIAGNLPAIGILADIGNLIWFAFRGTDGPNRYGPDPLQPGSDVFN